MIFYGSNSTALKKGKINNVTCPKCNAITSMNFAIYGEYAHVYWVPFFPMGRKEILECTNCHKTFYIQQMSESIKKKYAFEKQGTRTPIWYFSGVIIGVLGIVFLMYNSLKNDELEASYVQKPQVGDVYSFWSVSTRFYSTMKVSEVYEDSLVVLLNDYEIDQKSQTYKIDISKNYSGASEVLYMKEIQDLYDEGIIYSVDRD